MQTHVSVTLVRAVRGGGVRKATAVVCENRSAGHAALPWGRSVAVRASRPPRAASQDCLVRAVLRDMRRTLEGQLKTEVDRQECRAPANENWPPEGSACGTRDNSQ